MEATGPFPQSAAYGHYTHVDKIGQDEKKQQMEENEELQEMTAQKLVYAMTKLVYLKNDVSAMCMCDTQ